MFLRYIDAALLSRPFHLLNLDEDEGCVLGTFMVQSTRNKTPSSGSTSEQKERGAGYIVRRLEMVRQFLQLQKMDPTKKRKREPRVGIGAGVD